MSGGAGAVGSVAGQLLKLMGCSLVIGCAGSDEKVKLLQDECGFDIAFNYKTCQDMEQTLRELAPGGIDVFFDNVGGSTLHAALKNMNSGGRVAICGAISQYNNESKETAKEWFVDSVALLTKRISMKGFLLPDYYQHYNSARAVLAEYVKNGDINPLETVMEGFDQTFNAFLGLFSGQNVGKMVVKVENPPLDSSLLHTPPHIISRQLGLGRMSEEKRRVGMMLEEFGGRGATERVNRSLKALDSSIQTNIHMEEEALRTEEKRELGDEGSTMREEEEGDGESKVVDGNSQPKAGVVSTGSFTPINRFSWDDSGYNKPTVTVYVDLPNVGSVKDSVDCVFTPYSFDLTVGDLDGSSYRLVQNNLFKQIDPEKSKIKVKQNKISIKLAKVKGDYSYESWTKLSDDKKGGGGGGGSGSSSSKPNAPKKEDPMGNLMGMMKDMYDDGDDNMKKVIAEAMMKARSGEKPEDPMEGMGGLGGMGGGMGGMGGGMGSF